VFLKVLWGFYAMRILKSEQHRACEKLKMEKETVIQRKVLVFLYYYLLLWRFQQVVWVAVLKMNISIIYSFIR